jgi:hypothetical protein
MSQIKSFVSNTTHDLRGGRHSWRVVSLLCSTAFAISVGASLIH